MYMPRFGTPRATALGFGTVKVAILMAATTTTLSTTKTSTCNSEKRIGSTAIGSTKRGGLRLWTAPMGTRAQSTASSSGCTIGIASSQIRPQPPLQPTVRHVYLVTPIWTGPTQRLPRRTTSTLERVPPPSPSLPTPPRASTPSACFHAAHTTTGRSSPRAPVATRRALFGNSPSRLRHPRHRPRTRATTPPAYRLPQTWTGLTQVR
jgi:hypothetical protein